MFIFIVIAGILLDRVSKIWAVGNLSNSAEIPIIKNFFSLVYVENTGAAFGIFRDRKFILIVIIIVIMICIIYYIVKYRPQEKFIKISLSFIIGGAFGNLIDRVINGYVIDFISVHYRDVYYFPVFNVADIMVVCGTFVLVVGLLREERNGH